MAYIRAHSTRRKRNGKQVNTFAVVFREPGNGRRRFAHAGMA